MRSMPYGKPSALFLVAVLLWVPVALGDHPAAPGKASPRLYLVGVGPGDPDLITLRAIRVIKQSDLIFCTDGIQTKFGSYLQGKEVVTGYWRLFSYYGRDPSQLNEPERREAEQIAARRKQFIAKVRQAAATGKTIAILDHGDPLIYGPWAWCLEEFEDLHPVVVPGLSSFNAANAALGRGITTSRRTKSVILTATDWPGKTDTIERLSAHRCTMVLFTMRAEFPDLIKKLAVNYPPDTPLDIVEYAGYQGRQKVIRGTVGTILTQVGQEELPFEYLIYVGEFLTYRYKGRASPAAVQTHLKEEAERPFAGP
jgi:precorrin-4/cobalt-precorrin-4 C11-methyltransferase